MLEVATVWPPAENASITDDQFLNGSDGLAESHFEPSGRQHLQPSEKVMVDFVDHRAKHLHNFGVHRPNSSLLFKIR